MRSASIISLCSLFFGMGLAQVNRALQPTQLEAFAAQPTARATWSKEVGRIESVEARVVVTVLVVEDEVLPHHRMRGIRIETYESEGNRPALS